MGLIIRRKQLDSFSAALRADYVRQMVQHLQDCFPEECQAHDYNFQSLTSLVSKAIDDAESYGIQQPFDLQLYLECLAMLGPKFNSEAIWANILERLDLDGTTKMDAIHDHLIVKFAHECSASGDV